MNKKAEMNYAGIIVITAICIIIGASLLPTLGTYTGSMTRTYTLTNQSFTTGSNQAWVDLTGQTLISSPLYNNETYLKTSEINITIQEGISNVTGFKTIRMKTNNATWANKVINVSYTYGGDGYVEDSGSRAIVRLILVFFALLIMVVAIVPIFRQGFLQMVGLR